MPKLLSRGQQAAYEQDGFCYPVRALSAAEAAAYRARFEAYEKASGGWYEMSKGQKLYLLQTWAAELAANPRARSAKLRAAVRTDAPVWRAAA